MISQGKGDPDMKQWQSSFKKGSHRPISFMRIDVKILNKKVITTQKYTDKNVSQGF